MFAMILIHTNAYFLNNGVARVLWDACQFAVPVFVFCSSYLFFQKESHAHAAHTFSYYRKRTVRLLYPYYVFLSAYFLLLIFFDRKLLTGEYVTESVLLTGGVDLNWMVVLFLLISAVMPLIMYLYKRHRKLYVLYALAASASAILFLFIKPAFNYRYIMVLPWSLVSIVTWEVARKESSKKSLIIIALMWLSAFFISWTVLMLTGGSLVHFDNKYPPNLYHISYGIVWMVALLLISKQRKMPGFFGLFFRYLSTYSYSLFFIHFFLIFLAIYTIPYRSAGWLPFFILILFTSVVVQGVLNAVSHRFSTLKSGPTI